MSYEPKFTITSINYHVCLDCALKDDYGVQIPCKITLNKCRICKKVKNGTSGNCYLKLKRK